MVSYESLAVLVGTSGSGPFDAGVGATHPKFIFGLRNKTGGGWKSKTQTHFPGVGEDEISKDDPKTEDYYHLHLKPKPKITGDRRPETDIFSMIFNFRYFQNAKIDPFWAAAPIGDEVL